MAIWALTKERYEKLLNQIKDKEAEIDVLLKRSKEDLWNADLDDFMDEWNFQLEDEKKRRKELRGMKRRVSSKLRTQTGPSRKRKNNSDDEFGESKAKKANTKKAELKSLLTSYLTQAPKPPQKPAPKPAASSKAAPITLDGADGEESDVFLNFRKMAAKKEKEAKEKDSDDDLIRPAASRGARATRKPVRYDAGSDDSDEDMSDGDFDVGKMVKGIGDSDVAAVGSSRPLFSATASRPGSSAGLPRKSFGRDRSTAPMNDDDEDVTDYKALAPPSASGNAQPAKAKAVLLSDEEDFKDAGIMDVDPPTRATSAVPGGPSAGATSTKRGRKPGGLTKPKDEKASKTGVKGGAAKGKAKPAAKSAAPVVAKKQLTLSPAAKAYAAKQAKATSAAALKGGKGKEDFDDDDSDAEAMANDILSDEDDEDVIAAGSKKAVAAPAASRPARRAATQKKAWAIESDDEDEDEDEEESADFDDDDSD